MRRFGLIGYPLTHSFSKKYYQQKIEREGIVDCHYDNYPLEKMQDLERLLMDHPDLLGLNVTIPYKKSVIGYLHERSVAVDEIGACNCINIRGNKLYGYNTDVIGFEKSFVKSLQPHHTNALILGTGGAAAAIEYVLKKLSIYFQYVSRNANSKLATLEYNEVNAEIIDEHKVIINTTPLGMFPNINNCPPIPYQYINEQHYLYDVVYNPAQTLFLKKGEEQGATIMNGEEMLFIQAEENWKIWNER